MRQRAYSLVLAALIGVGACTGDDAAPPPTTTRYLTPLEHLNRASLALRGIRPSVDELEAVAADPHALPEIVDGYLDSPEFGATIRELHNQFLLLRFQQGNYTLPPVAQLIDKTFEEMNASVYDEPLRLIEDVVMSDRPYTDIVTADYTMADPIVATVWGMQHSANPGWERTTWPDGRGHAGILASTALYLRYRNVNFNYNRGRANAISRGLLCHDYLDSDIAIDTSVDLSDPQVVAHAVVENPTCAGCHQTLDPLASYFWPFWTGTLGDAALTSYPVTKLYNPDQAGRWFVTSHRPPSYFGQEVDGLEQLGNAIANDPRFARCAAIHFASYLTEVPPDALSEDWIATLAAGFVDGDYSAKQLARAIVLSDRFRVASDDDAGRAEDTVGYQKLRPQQLRAVLLDVTGYDWVSYSRDLIRGMTIGEYAYLDDDAAGYRVLAGGIDSFYVTDPVYTMTATASLVAQRAAYAAADHVVTHDAAAAPADRLLFTATTVDAIDEISVRAELVSLHARIYGEIVTADDPSVDDGYALFTGALATASGDPRRAWTITLTAMLSDVKALYY